MAKLLIGTTNPAKLEKWRNALKDFNLVSLKDINLSLDVEEGSDSLVENSKKKALTYAKASNLIALSEDTGFYIEELNGLPGVALRRWGGKLPNEISDEDFLEFFKQQVRNLQNTESHFITAVSIAAPNGDVKTLSHKTEGYIEKSRLNKPFNAGYPLSAVFIRKKNEKSWSEMTSEERGNYEEEFISEIKKEIESIFNNNQR